MLVGEDRRSGAELGAAKPKPDPEFEPITAEILGVAIGQREQDRKGAGGGREAAEAPPPRAAALTETGSMIEVIEMIGPGNASGLEGLQQPSAGAGLLAGIVEQQLLILRLAYGRKQARRAMGSVGH
ncbi:MAG: hypothetical protein R6X02_15085 [Enhygromyxa sp.]